MKINFLSVRKHYFFAIKINRLMFTEKTLFIVIIIQNTLIHFVGKNREFSALK